MGQIYSKLSANECRRGLWCFRGKEGQFGKGGCKMQVILSLLLTCWADWRYREGAYDPAALSTAGCWHLQGWGSAMQQVRVFPQSRGSCISWERQELSLLQKGVMPRPPGCTMALGMRTTAVHGLPPEGPAWGDIRGQTGSTPAFPSDCRQQAGLWRAWILFYFPRLDSMNIFKCPENLQKQCNKDCLDSTPNTLLWLCYHWSVRLSVYHLFVGISAFFSPELFKVTDIAALCHYIVQSPKSKAFLTQWKHHD